MAPIEVFAVSPSSINIDLAPTSPSAGENTRITLSSYGSNLDTVSISWFVNGKAISSDIGMKSFSVNAPQNGGETIVRAVITLPDGNIEKSVVIRPSALTLLWQATDSYVPPFYRGKAMPTIDSEVKVIALPEVKIAGKEISPKNLIYDWKKNYTNEAGASGYGKNFFSFVNDYLENLDTVSVTAYTTDGKYSSTANLNITASSPQISFYRNDPLLGTIWEMALKDGHTIQEGEGEIIVAEPYFIAPKAIWSPSLVWSWYINGELTNNVFTYRKNWMPIKVEGGISGTSTIGLYVENKDQLIGNVSKQINIEY